MLARLSAFVIWSLVAATAVFWGLRLLVYAPSAPAYTVAVGDATAVRGDLTRLLGAAPTNAPAAAAAPEAPSRFRLLGIVAPKYPTASNADTRGVALIAVDGNLPKAYAVGARIDGDLVLQSVSLRAASLAAGPGAPAITLELPLPTAAATGTLPVGGVGGGYVPPGPAQALPTYVPPPRPQIPAYVPPAAVPNATRQNGVAPNAPIGSQPVPQMGQPPFIPVPRPDATAPQQ